MDVSQYLGIFLDETDEHLQSLNEQIMTLENEPENQDCINEIFRIAHTIKGKGVSFMEDQAGWHGKAPNDEETERALAELAEARAELNGVK